MGQLSPTLLKFNLKNTKNLIYKNTYTVRLCGQFFYAFL